MQISLMGILNVTPDSFSDGGNYLDPQVAIQHADMLLNSGADWIDIGGVSTGPRSQPVPVEVEWTRIAPVLEMLVSRTAISLDTYQPEIARRACALGIKAVNDVSGTDNPAMWEVIADSNMTLISMYASNPVHTFEARGSSETVRSAILKFFERKLAQADQFGIERGRLILDPGMGAFLSPQAQDSWWVLDNISTLLSIHPRVLVGTSRKGFLLDSLRGELCSTPVTIETRDLLSAGSMLLALSALDSEIKVKNHRLDLMFRVHDVKSHMLLKALFLAKLNSRDDF